MVKMLILLVVSMCLAYCAQRDVLTVPLTQKRSINVPLVIMIVMLSLVVGLRTNYNDTFQYIASFLDAPTPQQYLNSKPELLDYPLFYWFQSFFRHNISDNYHLFFLIIATFTNASFICFFKKHSDDFAFSILIFFSIGLYMFTMAAMKQCLAMAFLTFALNALIDKKYVKFYFWVFIAMLIHAYAVLFAVLPLFTNKPWTILTYCSIIAVVFVVFTFESTITSFLEFTEDTSREISEEYIIGTVGINLFRLAVYAAAPLISFIFQELLNDNYTHTQNIMMNVSILSFLIMAMGLTGGANFFGRAAVYFVLGTVCILPWIVKQIFSEESKAVGTTIVGSAYLLFFMYSLIGFSSEYAGISVWEFIKTL